MTKCGRGRPRSQPQQSLRTDGVEFLVVAAEVDGAVTPDQWG